MPRLMVETVQQLKDCVDLREIAAQYTALQGHGKELYGPCPRCGGVNRFHCQAGCWFCRRCSPPEPGKGSRDCYDFAQFMGLARDFREAYEVVAAWARTPLSPVRPVKLSRAMDNSYKTATWQSYARQEVIRCHTLLVAEAGSLGQAYLYKRHLLPSTWEIAQLGLTPRIDAERRKGWAISIPWLYNGAITAIQYRFIEPRTQRYSRYQCAGSSGETILFMCPSKGHGSLVICEGEINAMSVWQASAHDAISVGSQNMTRNTLEALKSHINRYQDIFVWFDEKPVAETLIQALGGRGEAIVADGDANELLQQSRLRQVLA
jgi:hypothetical protein